MRFISCFFFLLKSSFFFSLLFLRVTALSCWNRWLNGLNASHRTPTQLYRPDDAWYGYFFFQLIDWRKFSENSSEIVISLRSTLSIFFFVNFFFSWCMTDVRAALNDGCKVSKQLYDTHRIVGQSTCVRKRRSIPWVNGKRRFPLGKYLESRLRARGETPFGVSYRRVEKQEYSKAVGSAEYDTLLTTV